MEGSLANCNFFLRKYARAKRHIIMDNYATHKTAAVKTWLARRPHYRIHFTPTSASCINQVERWFAPHAGRRG
jgi:transposase